MKTYEFDSIGTHWWLEILDDSHVFAPELIATLRRTANQFEQRYSRFRDDSLVAELFRSKRLSHPPVEMIRMLEFAREMYQVSNGAFDITVGNDLHRMGYGKRSIARTVETSKFWNEIVITPAKIIHPGEIMLEDQYDSSTSIDSIQITRGALAGSNTIKRTWRDGDTEKHHIIDPATHDSSDTAIVASYVAAESALIADTMAMILTLRPELERTLKTTYHITTKLILK